MFKALPPVTGNTVTLSIDGLDVTVGAGTTVATAALISGLEFTRQTPALHKTALHKTEHGAPRAPYCMMGVCFDCLMTIDGTANQRACQSIVADGMVVTRQLGKREIKS